MAGYKAQTNPGGSTALPGASASAFGGEIAEGIERVGATIDRIGERQKARERDSQNTAAGLELATIAGDLDKAEIDARENAEPGAAGHSEKIGTIADKRIGDALGRIKDPRIRQAYQARYADLKGNVFSRAYGFERTAHTQYMVSNAGETTRILANGQANNPDAAGLQVSLETVGTMWDNLSVAADVKEKGKKDAQREIAIAYAQSMADQDPDLFLGNKGEKRPGLLELVSPYLNADDIDRLRTRGQSELARLEAKQRQAEVIGEKTYREDLSATGKRITTLADYTITDKEFDALEESAKKYGDKSGLIDIANWRDLRDVALETRDYTPAQWSDATGKLEAIEPDKRTPAQSLRLKHLQELRGPAEAKFNSNPQEWGNGAGMPAPAIDWENPSADQGAARVRWNSAFMAATGSNSALLGKLELDQFKQRIQTGGLVGSIEAAQTLRNVFGVAGAKMAIDQIDPNNAGLKIMIGLPAHTAADYKLGIDAYRRDPKLINADVAREVFDDYARGIPQQLRGVVWDAARAIAAAELDRAGGGEPDEDAFKETFRRALNRAAGAVGSGEAGGAGGFVRWGDRPLWIPPEMPKAEAIRRLSRSSAKEIIEANVGPNGTGPGGQPYYLGRDGKPVAFGDRAGELIKRGELETVAPGVFRVILEDGGHVINKNGQPWQFDIRKLK